VSPSCVTALSVESREFAYSDAVWAKISTMSRRRGFGSLASAAVNFSMVGFVEELG